MTEELESIKESVKQEMEAAIKHLDHAFQKIRAGRASSLMIQDVKVDYYGSLTPIHQVANISIPDSATISIQPWEKNIIGAIEKAIINSNLGFSPSNNGEQIMLNVPALTEERRKELSKQAKAETESTKVVIRNSRQEGNKNIKKLEGVSEDLKKTAEISIQNITDDFVKKSDDMLKHKEAEIMKV